MGDLSYSTSEIDLRLSLMGGMIGNAIVNGFNQLVKNGNFADGTANWSGSGGTISAASNKLTFTATNTAASAGVLQVIQNPVVGHKYFISYNVTPSRSGTTRCYLGGYASPSVPTQANVKKHNEAIITAINTSGYTYFYPNQSGNVVGDTGVFEDIWITDLTAMFGTGNEPTIEQFRHLYTDSYYPPTPIYKYYPEPNAGTHNSLYRGKYLGSSVTAAQYAAISAGTFDDLYIGDYWIIGGVYYRIAAFDYYFNVGDVACTTHHAVIVPDSTLYTHAMNDTNVTTGGYTGSKMYTEGLANAKTTIKNAFGASHILSHRSYLTNAVTNGYPSAGAWFDSEVELMNENNVYGGKMFTGVTCGTNVPALYTIDKGQFPLFALEPSRITNRATYWLRDVVSASLFAVVTGTGVADKSGASASYGVRPAFCIKG